MYRVFLWIYSVLYGLLLPLYFLVFVYRVLFQDKELDSLLRRAGRPPQIPDEPAADKPAIRIWVHAVSVGEVKAIQPLVDALKRENNQLLVSTVTQTGQEMASHLFGDRAHVFYFPLDWQWICRRFLRAVRPAVILIAESELWPGFIAASHSLNIPILLINGRVSDRSFRRYRSITFLVQPLLKQITHFCMQTCEDEKRILEMGATPSRVNQMGNLKYDYHLVPSPQQESMVQLVRTAIKPDQNSLLWICGSTRDGEEEILLDVFQTLLEGPFSLQLLLAPRHPHRAHTVFGLLQQRQLTYLRRSQLQEEQLSAPQVLVLDTIGELSYLYQLADLVFVGGSLFPTGGHNIIEAAYFGKPILFGPYMENFKEIATSFRDSNAALQVQSGEELMLKIRDLIMDPAAREGLGRNARQVIRDNQGALNRTIDVVRKYTGRKMGEAGNSQLTD
jgi:3-deoxy-D-manno-octulosonic-acid transferase